jgi:hypothetical protein
MTEGLRLGAFVFKARPYSDTEHENSKKRKTDRNMLRVALLLWQPPH